MSDSTIDAQAPTPASEIAEIEKAVSAETESAKQTEVAEGGELSNLDSLLEKKGFGSVDDLADAYTNLESKMNPTMKELKELKEMVKGIQESSKPEVKDPFDDLPQEQREAMDLLNQLLDRQLNTKLSPILKKFEVDEASAEINEVRGQFPGISDVELETAISTMEKYPSMTLGDAVKLASYDRATSSARKRTEKTQKKKATFTESATSARTGDSTDYSKMSLEELESMLDIPSHLR